MNHPPLWQGAELSTLFNVNSLPDIAGISIDSRSVEPGDLFIALSGDPGPRFGGGDPNARDGHDFIASAIASGASCVMVHRPGEWPVPSITVEDTLDGLWALGRQARQRAKGSIVAVTGSAGKTTMRSWLESLLGLAGGVHASVGSFNNHWGVPLSLSRMPAQSPFGVFEIGTNHAGEIAPLSSLVRPDVSVLLNVLPAHIGNFAGMAALEEEKLSIAAGLNGAGTFVLPQRFAHRVNLPGTRLLTFGLEQDAGVRLVEPPTHSATGETAIRVDVCGVQHELRIPFADEPRIISVLAALGIIAALEVDLDQVAPAFERLMLPVGRGNEYEADGILIIDDSYNANPGSMSLALDNLRQRPVSGIRIALLGEMLELGDMADEAHEAVSSEIEGLDKIFTFGMGFAGKIPSAIHYDNVHEFDLDAFAASLSPGDVLLVKGSNKVFWQHGFVRGLTKRLQGSRE